MKLLKEFVAWFFGVIFLLIFVAAALVFGLIAIILSVLSL